LSTVPSTAPSALPSTRPSGDAIERTVTGLGYDLVDVERLARGLLRVTIDRIPGHAYGSPGAPDDGEFITVEDCERVTRQLQLALEVAGLDYARLEVSSPGLDRPLKTLDHWRRFAGQAVSLTLKLPFQNRKHWTGVLQPVTDTTDDAGDAWRLEITQDKNTLALDFRFDEVREMRLVPVVDFKGRRKNPDVKNAAPAADAALNGEQDR
jgi:ribosome maturation factor RimP